MGNIKTAISLQKTLFEQVEAIAREMKISRSRFFVLAVEEFIQRYQNRQLLEKINDAYEDGADPSEQSRLQDMQRQHRRIVEGEW